MYQFFKKIVKPARLGIKYTKGLVATYTVATNKPIAKTATFLSESIGMIFLPVLVLLIEPVLKKLPAYIKEKLPLVFYTGIAIGSSLGTLLSSSILKRLPSHFGSLIGLVSSFVVVPLVVIGVPFLLSKLRKRGQSPAITESESILDNHCQPRFRLGIEAGLLIGSTLGASLEFFIPNSGLIGSALGGFIGTCIGAGLAAAFPTFARKLAIKSAYSKDSKRIFSDLSSSIKFGMLLGSCIGIIIGTFLLPGIGSVLGGILFGGIAAVTTSLATGMIKKFDGDKPSFFGKIFTKASLATTTLSMKIGISSLSLIGALIGTFLLPGIGTVAGAAIGGAIGCLVGAVTTIISKHRQQNIPLSSDVSTASQKNDTASLKRVKIGFSLGSCTGALAGAIIGSCIPIVGTALGTLAGAFIGGMICVAIPALINKLKLLKKPVAATVVDKPSLPTCTPEITDTIKTKQSYHLITNLTEKNTKKEDWEKESITLAAKTTKTISRSHSVPYTKSYFSSKSLDILPQNSDCQKMWQQQSTSIKKQALLESNTDNDLTHMLITPLSIKV